MLLPLPKPLPLAGLKRWGIRASGKGREGGNMEKGKKGKGREGKRKGNGWQRKGTAGKGMSLLRLK